MPPLAPSYTLRELHSLNPLSAFPPCCVHTHTHTHTQCRDVCVEVQDHFLKELRDLGEVDHMTIT